MFLYPALTIGFAFVGVPLLVHLINMLRHRRQRWAAMDFLLASYRKQKNWIRLKQLLLLLSRLAIAATLVAMLAGWVAGGKWMELAGSRTTHHVVILDDSYSMGDTSGGNSAYGRALAALRGLAEKLATTDGSHQLTVMRSSRAGLLQQAGAESADAAADLSARTIIGDASVINRVMASAPTSLKVDLVPAMELATKLIRGTPADETLVYLASDFRAADWQSPQRAAESIAELSRAGAKVRMIDCALSPSQNLAITSVSPQPDVWVAGVPVVIRASVKNYGTSAAKNVAVSGRVIQYGTKVTLGDPTKRVSGEVEQLPAIVIDEIPAGGEVTKSFQVFITQTGTHSVELTIPDDALAIDNQRACTLPLTDVEKVLIVDGDQQGRGAYFVASVLNPGSQVRTGALPEIQPLSFIRSITLEQLEGYRAVYLIDVPDVSENSAEALFRYVNRGGGLYWFLGSGIDRDAYNRTVAGTRRLLPSPLGESIELPERSAESSGDCVLGAAHPLTAPLAPIGDAAFALVAVTRSWSLEPAEQEVGASGSDEWSPVRQIVLRRDGRPLVTQHDVGEGRVVTSLVGIDSRWTNWAGDPTFVVMLLQANAYLWSAASPAVEHIVTQELRRSLPPETYAATVSFFPPADEPPRVPIELTVSDSKDDRAASIDVKAELIANDTDVDSLLQTGIGEWVLTRLDGQTEVEPVAMVIEGGEGDLKRVEPAEVQRAVRPVDVRFVSAGELVEQYNGSSGSTTTLLLLALLGLLLAGEQCLAYASSYHPAAAANAVGPVGSPPSRLALSPRGARR
ncbi:MAG: BatA domain-containing protein [Planctomycetaceae bacterium]